MTHWTLRALSDLSRSLAADLELVGEPPDRAARFEAITLAKLVDRCVEAGFAPVGDSLDLARTNHAPYRRVTQGSGVDHRADVEDVVSWVTPLVELERSGRSLAFFREGTPFARTRDRPDLLVYRGSFEVTRGSDPFVGDHVAVSWDGDRSGERRYKRETDTSGPVVAEDRGDPPTPVLGMEVSLNKSCDRLREQVDLLWEFGCERVAALLEHGNPCDEGEFHADEAVFKATDERAFHSSMNRLGDDLLRRVSDE